MERPKPHEASTRLSLGQVLATLAAHDLVRSPKPAERHLVPAGEQIYWLGKRGAEQVAGLQGQQVQAFPWCKAPRWSILQHDLAVNDFRKCGEARRYRPQCEHVWAWCACDMPVGDQPSL